MAISCSLKSMVSQSLQKIGQVIHLCNVTLRRTRRGIRAGIRGQREIRVFTSKNCRDQNLTCYIQQGVNINNLIKLPLVNIEGFLKSGGETTHKEKVLKKHSRSSNFERRICSDKKLRILKKINFQSLIPTQRKHNLVFGVLNCRSIKTKALSISDYVVSNKVDIFAMTETWLGSTFDDVIKQELIPTSYDFLHLNRENRRGGGIALLFRKEIDIKYLPNKDLEIDQFEYMDFSLCLDKTCIRLSVIYRPLHQNQMIYEPAYFLTNGIPTLIKLSQFPMKPLSPEILISISMMKEAQMQ